MDKRKMTYYDFAEDDYKYLKNDIEEGKVSNAMCSLAQHVCEKYFKSIIADIAYTDIMRTHSLKKLSKFIKKNLPDFDCDWEKILPCDGYYFTARYPGDEAFFIDEDDVKICDNAITEAKRAVDRYRLKSLNTKKKEDLSDIVKCFDNSLRTQKEDNKNKQPKKSKTR